MPATRGTARLIGTVGVVLVVLGLTATAYVGWQTWGTTWQSERRHQDLRAGLERVWRDAGTPSAGSTVTGGAGSDGAAGVAGVAQATLQTEYGVVSGVLRIPAFGDDFAVPILEGTSDAALAAGVGHFDGTAAAGQPGNFALAGHRVTHGEPLRDLPSLQAGDRVVVETADWVYTYVLDTAGGALEVPFTETWVVDELPRNPDPGEPQPAQQPGQRLITLTTCAELFHTDRRLVAFGHLERRQPRPAPG